MHIILYNVYHNICIHNICMVVLKITEPEPDHQKY